MNLELGSVANHVIDAWREQTALPPAGANAVTQPACECSPETDPGFPDKPSTDPGAGVHGSQPWYARGGTATGGSPETCVP